MAKENLLSAARLRRSNLIRVTGTRHNALSSQREAGKSHTRAAEQAFSAAASGGQKKRHPRVRRNDNGNGNSNRKSGGGWSRETIAHPALPMHQEGTPNCRSHSKKKATSFGERFARDSVTGKNGTQRTTRKRLPRACVWRMSLMWRTRPCKLRRPPDRAPTSRAPRCRGGDVSLISVLSQM